MCLSPSALALFLNTLMVPVTTEPGTVIVHASAGDAHWVSQGENWCTIAPSVFKAKTSSKD